MKLRTFAIVMALIAAGGLTAWLLVLTKPVTKRTPPPVSSPMVHVMPAVIGQADLTVNALGTVRAAQETVIRARVSGQVDELAPQFEAGGLIKAGGLLVRIDPEDYRNALALKKSALAKAKADYALEMGQQRVARTEVKQLDKTMPGAVKNSSLALREPQLAQARAALQAAETEVQQAQLSLERTRVVAPYNALVSQRNVSLGSQASTSDELATLVGTDEYRIEAAIPLDKMQALGLKAFDGAEAKVFSGTGHGRKGVVLHAVGTLDDTTRMGRILISVPDPLGLENGEPALLLGDQARVVLYAGKLTNVIMLPRAALRGGERVWVAVPNGEGGYTLDIRNVQAAWKDTEKAHISAGLQAGDLIITSVLGAPVQGMPVRIAVPRKNKDVLLENAKPLENAKTLENAKPLEDVAPSLQDAAPPQSVSDTAKPREGAAA